MNLHPLTLFWCRRRSTEILVFDTSILRASFCFCLMSLVSITIDLYCHSVSAILNSSSSSFLSLICVVIMVCIPFVLKSWPTNFSPFSYISLTNLFCIVSASVFCRSLQCMWPAMLCWCHRVGRVLCVNSKISAMELNVWLQY